MANLEMSLGGFYLSTIIVYMRTLRLREGLDLPLCNRVRNEAETRALYLLIPIPLWSALRRHELMYSDGG